MVKNLGVKDLVELAELLTGLRLPEVGAFILSAKDLQGVRC